MSPPRPQAARFRLKARRYTDFRAMKWSKLLFNILGMPERHPGPAPSHIFADSELFRYERAAFREATAVMDRMRVAVVGCPACRTQPAAR